MKNYTLITGASSGIGRAIAIKLSQTRNLVLVARNENMLNETKSLCDKNSDIVVLSIDLSKADEMEKILVNFLKEKNIGIENFVYCAGVAGMRPLRSFDYDFILDTFNVNLFSFMLMLKVLKSKKFNPALLSSVVAISSNIAEMGAKAFGAYGASKAGLNGFVRCLALEMAPNTRINAISPGGIHTKMTEAMQVEDEVAKRFEALYPMGLGKTSDIADATEFLLSENSRWITGQNLIIDGGRTINLNG